MDSQRDLQNLQQMVRSQLERDQSFKQNKARQLASLLQVSKGSVMGSHEVTDVPLRQQAQLDIGMMGGTLKPLVPWKHKTTPASSSTSTLKHTLKAKRTKPRKLIALDSHPHGRGIIRSIDVVRFPEPTTSSVSSVYSESTASSEVSEQLLHDVTSAFKDIYGRRHVQQKVDEERHAFISRIKTPPELANDELTTYRSRDLYNEIADDLNSVISNASAAASNFSQEFSVRSLSSKTATVLSDLHSAYTHEGSSYHSAALFVEARYLELKETEKDTGNVPTHNKAVVIADLAMTLTKALGRFSPIMEPLLWELMNCIFVNFAGVETKRVGAEKPIHQLQELATFFDKYHQTQTMLEDVQSELGIWQKGNSMKDLVKKFQTIRLAFDKSAGFVRDTCFRLWKRYSYEWRKRREKARLMATRYRWRTWRLFLEERHLDSLNEYSRNIENKISRCLKFYEDAMAKKKKGFNSPSPVESSLKMLLPADEKAYSIKKYLERLSKAVSDKLGVVEYEIEEPVVPVPQKSPMTAPLSLFSNQHLLTRGPSAAKLDMRGPSMRNMRMQSALGLGTLNEDEAHVDDNGQEGESSEPPAGLLARQSSKMIARPAPLQSQLSRADITSILEMGRSSSSSSVGWHNLKLGANICQDQITQTPDDWMADIPEAALDADEIARMKLQTKFKVNDDDCDYEDAGQGGGSDSMDTSRTMGSSVADSSVVVKQFQLSPEVASHLIAFIYQSRILDAQKDPAMLEFKKDEPMLEYIKEIFLKRYRIRRLSNKFYRGLVSCCLREASNHRRLELFGQLCGLSLVQRMGQAYDPKRCSFFFQMLFKFFGEDIELMISTFLTNVMNRQIILDTLPTIFVAVEKYDFDLYEAIMFEIIDLPCMDPPNIDKEFKVDVDEALSTIMEYYDVELEERESHKIKQRREQIAISKKAGKTKTPRSAAREYQSAPNSPHSSERSSPVRHGHLQLQQPYNPAPMLQQKLL